MAPSRGGAPGRNVAAGTGVGLFPGLPPGGRPPGAEGVKAERPHHSGGPRGHRARQANPHVIGFPCPTALSRGEVAPSARGALRAPLKPY